MNFHRHTWLWRLSGKGPGGPRRKAQQGRGLVHRALAKESCGPPRSRSTASFASLFELQMIYSSFLVSETEMMTSTFVGL